MSARKPRLVLTPRARNDLRDILRYTARTWGSERRDAYRAALMRRLHELTDYPELGGAREELFPGCRGLRVEQHVAYYRSTATEIVVSRILHVRQEAIGAVPDPALGEALP
jgi:toxin ParE1/3/4